MERRRVTRTLLTLLLFLLALLLLTNCGVRVSVPKERVPYHDLPPWEPQPHEEPTDEKPGKPEWTPGPPPWVQVLHTRAPVRERGARG